MKINLAILYGVDNKLGLVNNTIKRCYNYFDNIFLINAGGDFTFNLIKDFADDKVLIFNVDNLWGDTSSTKGRILCTHGWLDNSNSFSYLGPILAAKGYEIIAIDWLGHGHSDHIEGLSNQLSITSELKDKKDWFWYYKEYQRFSKFRFTSEC
jgi:pimeloyl-ACP methyl ester carboxylesterase